MLPPKLKLKRDDQVIVISGKDKGHVGKILSFNRVKQVVFVEGANIQKKHRKATKQGDENKILEQEGPIHYSNVLPYNEQTGKGERIKIVVEESGAKIRYLAKSNVSMDK